MTPAPSQPGAAQDAFTNTLLSLGEANRAQAQFDAQMRMQEAEAEAAAKEAAAKQATAERAQGLREARLSWDQGGPGRKAEEDARAQASEAMDNALKAAVMGDFDGVQVWTQRARELGVDGAAIARAISGTPSQAVTGAPGGEVPGPARYQGVDDTSVPVETAEPDWQAPVNQQPQAPSVTQAQPSAPGGPPPGVDPGTAGPPPVQQQAVAQPRPAEPPPEPSPVVPDNATGGAYAQAAGELRDSLLSAPMGAPRRVEEAAANVAYEAARGHRGERGAAVEAGRKAHSEYLARYFQEQRSLRTASAMRDRSEEKADQGIYADARHEFEHELTMTTRLNSVKEARSYANTVDKLLAGLESGDPSVMRASAFSLVRAITGETRPSDKDFAKSEESIRGGLIEDAKALAYRLKTGKGITSEMINNGVDIARHYRDGVLEYQTALAKEAVQGVMLRERVRQLPPQERRRYLKNIIIKMGWQPFKHVSDDGEESDVTYDTVINVAAREVGEKP